MGEAFQLFEVDEDTQSCRLLENWDKRRIHLVVDALSSRNFRSMKLDLIKKLTEIGSSKLILPLLESLKRFTCVHDYLHETRLHRQDVIYRLMYGCFLQALQCHIGEKGLCGEPAKRKVQSHEKFLYKVDNAMRRWRWKRFVDQLEVNIFEREEHETGQKTLSRVDKMYKEYCDSWIEGLDEPTIACALFMKYMDSYRRCVDGVKKRNTWLMEIEGALWLGAFKLAEKQNYVTETLHREDVLYGEDMPSEELEWKRRNQLFLMTEGGNAMSLDEVNELLNLWNKGTVTAQDFETVCERSRYVMVSRASAFDSFGCQTKKSVSPSTEVDIPN